MVDRLRLWLDRPLNDADRPRLFALAVAVIVATAAVLAALDDAGPAPAPLRAASSPPAPPADPATEGPGSSRTPAAPAEEGELAGGSVAPPRTVARVKQAARRFLAGYLPYVYGDGGGDVIAGATAALRRRLEEDRPRVPLREQRRRARVLLVQADGVGRSRARVAVLVADGRRRYTVALELARTAAGWRVTSVGG